MERKCNECANKLEMGCKKWSCEFEPKYADPTEDAGTLAEQKVVHCNFTDAEIAKEFIKDVKAVDGLLPDAEMDKFVSLTYVDDTKTYIKADAIVEMYEEKGRTCVFTINSDVKRNIKESVDEIVARIGGIV